VSGRGHHTLTPVLTGTPPPPPSLSFYLRSIAPLPPPPPPSQVLGLGLRPPVMRLSSANKYQGGQLHDKTPTFTDDGRNNAKLQFTPSVGQPHMVHAVSDPGYKPEPKTVVATGSEEGNAHRSSSAPGATHNEAFALDAAANPQRSRTTVLLAVGPVPAAGGGELQKANISGNTHRGGRHILEEHPTAAVSSHHTPEHTPGFVAAVAAFMVIEMAEAAGGLTVVAFVLALCVTRLARRGRILGRRAAPYCSGERTAIVVLLWMCFWGGRYCVFVGAAPMTDVEFTSASWGEYTCGSWWFWANLKPSGPPPPPPHTHSHIHLLCITSWYCSCIVA
jgi:hypothetical protein